jgi:lipopolysaccharide biosynthesis protein
MKKKARVIAFYLPQYHPIEENDNCWGKGFTEWTNVTKAKALYKGHNQPHLPADLGFYDLRVPESREQQSKIAQEHGVEAFCYWHYWMGNGKRLLERPFNEVLESGEPSISFCLGWANESWTGRWLGLDNKVIAEQSYPGEEDHIAHFNAVLPAFKDSRYFKVKNKPLFLIYRPQNLPDPNAFIKLWQKLAKDNGLEGIYFVGVYGKQNPLTGINLDALVSNSPRIFKLKTLSKLFQKLRSKTGVNLIPTIYNYDELVKQNLEMEIQENEFPVVIPNWDNTPRSLNKGVVIEDSTPEKFKNWMKFMVDKVQEKEDDERIVFVKSWNEWAEGNYLEPDREFGYKYLEALKESIF